MSKCIRPNCDSQTFSDSPFCSGNGCSFARPGEQKCSYPGCKFVVMYGINNKKVSACGIKHFLQNKRTSIETKPKTNHQIIFGSDTKPHMTRTMHYLKRPNT